MGEGALKEREVRSESSDAVVDTAVNSPAATSRRMLHNPTVAEG
jgi:hypothetical protein